jgi:hypothetical protein
MSFLRHNLFSLTAALLGALAVLYVSTAALAFDAAADQGAAPMSMSGDSGPCDKKAETILCQKACAIFCQGLIPQAGSPAPAVIYMSIHYPSLDAPDADFTLEADDPPPRT